LYDGQEGSKGLKKVDYQTVWMKKASCAYCHLECQGIHCLKLHEATCLDQQHQVLKKSKEDDQESVILWLHSNLEASQYVCVHGL
jgi:hypothetical protein